MQGWLAVGVGGALGSMARHAMNRFVVHNWPALQVPAATIAVNVSGCVIAGVLAGAVVAARPAPSLYWREFLLVGVLGGFTTFSTFSLETVALLRAGAHGIALASVGAQLFGGLAGAYAGLVAAERLLSR